MSFGTKVWKVYQHSEEDLFPNVEEVESHIALLDKIRLQKVAKSDIPVTPAAKVIID